MKTIICLLLCSTALTMLPGQRLSIDEFFNSIPESEEVFKFELSGFFLKMAADESGAKKNGIKSIRILGADHSDLIPGNAISKLQKGLHADSFETLSEIRSGGDRIQIMMKEKKSIISEFVALIKGDEGFLVVAIKGSFNLDDLDDLDIEIDGLDKIKDIRKDIPRA